MSIKDLRARYNANGNAVIPNTFQHPNIFVDKLMYYLSPEENVVLTFAVRRILGFQTNIMSRKDNISLSQFTDGIQSESGEVLAHGCGLGINTIRTCLDSLSKYKILTPTTERPNPVKGQEYWLQDNENNIDWQALEERKTAQKVTYQKRTAKATEKSLEVRSNVGRKEPITSDVIEGVTSDVNTKPTETNGNTHCAKIKKTIQEQADRKVDAILELEAKAAKEKTKNWTYREKFSFNADMLDLADLCAKKFGPPTKRDLSLWIMEIGDWCDFGIRAKDWARASEIVAGFSMPILSVTGMTKALRAACQERKEGAMTAERPEYKKFVPEEGNYVPRPANVPLPRLNRRAPPPGER